MSELVSEFERVAHFGATNLSSYKFKYILTLNMAVF